MDHDRDDAQNCEYLVRVEWQGERPRSEAFFQKGLYAQRMPVTKLDHPSTVKAVLEYFELPEGD